MEGEKSILTAPTRTLTTDIWAYVWTNPQDMEQMPHRMTAHERYTAGEPLLRKNPMGIWKRT